MTYNLTRPAPSVGPKGPRTQYVPTYIQKYQSLAGTCGVCPPLD